jgi:hypothetical protein
MRPIIIALYQLMLLHLFAGLPLMSPRELMVSVCARRIRMMYKLTDIHLSPATQCAMKVSLAAQVMSHTVAAGIYSLVSEGNEQCFHSFSKVTY